MVNQTVKRILTEVEKTMVDRLTSQVTFQYASFDKRFCGSLKYIHEFTEKQINYIYKCFHKYRKQITDYEKIKATL